MKLKFLHDSKYFNTEKAQEQTIKAGQIVDIPDSDVNAFLAGDNPRAEVVTKEKEEPKVESKTAPVVEAKAAPTTIKKAKPTITKKAKRK